MRVRGFAITVLLARAATAQAQVSGRVTDSTTGKGIDGVEVRIAGTAAAATTNADGRYTITGLTGGRHVFVVRRVGYRGIRSAATVGGAATSLDFRLQPAVSTLDELVVAGSVIEAKKKQAPVPITVINEAQIQTPSRNKVEQLFRGDVPGVVGFDVNGQVNSTFALVRGRATLDLYNLIKVYIDDIELPSNDLISSIDLKNIERIELLRGPQASTIYGANASGGVLLLFTKKGRQGGPRISGSTAAGFINSDFVSSAAATENNLNVAGGGPGFTYSFGGSLEANGDVTPEVDYRRYGFNGRTQITQGKVTLGLTGAISRFINGSGNVPKFDDFFKTLYDLLTPPVAQQFGIPAPGSKLYRDQKVANQTLGATFTYQPFRNWNHSLTVGYGRFRYDTDQYRPTLNTPADTFRLQYNEDHDDASVRYNTTGNLTVGPTATLTLTGGLDWARRSTSIATSNRVRGEAVSAPGNFTPGRIGLSRGIYGQGVLGIKDQLFLTGAMRLEHFSSTGATLNDEDVAAPRVGVAYSIPLTNAVLKPRIAYGKGVRPPQAWQIVGNSGSNFRQLPNPALRPEIQTGFDGGFDLDVSSGKYSFEATYFNQKAKDLITETSSVQTQPAFFVTRQYVNVAKVSNKGLELAGTANFGRLTLHAQFTALKSKVLEVSAPTTGTLNITVRPGDDLPYAVEKSGGGSAVLSFGPAFAKPSGIDGMIEVGLTYLGSRISIDQVGLISCQILQLPQFCGTVNPATATERDFRVTLPGLTKVRVAFSHPLARELEGFVNVENLFDNQDPEMQTVWPSRGRMVLFGLRFGR